MAAVPTGCIPARSIVGSISVVRAGLADNDLDIDGGIVDSVSFDGSSGDDSATINAQVNQSLTFDGQGGNNSLEVAGESDSANLTTNISLGSDGNNIAILDGALGSSANPFTVHGGTGDDRFIVLPTMTGNVTLAGETGNNTYVLSGASAQVTVDQPWLGVSDQSTDTLDFSTFHSSAVNVDLSSTQPQTEGPLTLQLTDGMGISNVIGTQFVDSITGNARSNYLQRAAYQQSSTTTKLDRGCQPGNRNSVGVCRLRHVYARRDRRCTTIQRPSVRPWLIRLTSTIEVRPTRIPSIRGTTSVSLKTCATFHQTCAETSLTSDQYITIFVNATPSNGQPGGESSEIDPGNRDLSGVAVVGGEWCTGE